MPSPSTALEYRPTPQLLGILVFLIAPLFYALGRLMMSIYWLVTCITKMLLSDFLHTLYNESDDSPTNDNSQCAITAAKTAMEKEDESDKAMVAINHSSNSACSSGRDSTSNDSMDYVNTLEIRNLSQIDLDFEPGTILREFIVEVPHESEHFEELIPQQVEEAEREIHPVECIGELPNEQPEDGEEFVFRHRNEDPDIETISSISSVEVTQSTPTCTTPTTELSEPHLASVCRRRGRITPRNNSIDETLIRQCGGGGGGGTFEQL